MRNIGYLLVAGVLLLLAVWLVPMGWQALDTRVLAAYLSGQIDDARPSNVYLQEGNNWLEFQLDGSGSSVHVISNATVRRSAASNNATVWWYAFDYQLIGADGILLQEGVYHHRTRVTWYREASRGHLLTSQFLLDPLLVPTDGRRMIVPFEATSRPVRLRLRINHTDAALRDVMFRVYEQETVAAYKLDYRWQRLNDPKKELLARGSVYGSEHLRAQEKLNLLRNRWRPLGPAGIKDDDYATGKLYVRQDLPGENVEDTLLPYGLYVDSHTNGIVPLPEGGGRIHLQWAPLAGGQGSDPDGPLVVRWYGRSLGQRSETVVASSSAQNRFEADFGDGLLELQSSRALVVRAYLGGHDPLEEVTPEALTLRAYRPDASLPVEFHIDHVAQQPTPLRIDVRRLLSAESSAIQEPVRFELLDAGGEVLHAGILNQDSTSSRYDRFASIDPGRQLSEPARTYFRLPPRVAGIRVHAGGQALIAGYSRPDDLVREVRYPEDLYAVSADTQDTQPAWFVLRPARRRSAAAGRTLRLGGVSPRRSVAWPSAADTARLRIAVTRPDARCCVRRDPGRSRSNARTARL